jgi:hypothetical protein
LTNLAAPVSQYETFDGSDQIANNRWRVGAAEHSVSELPPLLREHEVQVLNRCAGRAFAEIIENRG